MDKDLCANCAHWREEHYGVNGEWQGNLFGCAEYQGTEPDDERSGKKADEIRASRKKLQQLRSQRAASFYDTPVEEDAPVTASSSRRSR